ncbi:flagellar hook-associated protein 1 FlgK [Mariprofundus ferrinatatus]|uniref:Flagellar hook-associated protein 1 n=1 Tax=Mariprofundus ferrinatatus TaxID=1921087 RepID=A0A2K8LAL2_9PROT|nr:flagellar hook-associated protein FlgK [Mariprofundus ferrinatatus]ATX82951.1 flagellar hook-associated protein 1 FlgK [Mariprofundus ferrinatatus]
MIVRTLQIASKSLTTQQQAMDTVSQNIANVNTAGYSRQSANLTTSQPDRIGLHNFGNGVELASISRSMDPLVANAQISNSTQSAYANTIRDGLTSVEATFGNLGAPGLTSSLDAFFTAQQLLTNSPDDPITRTDMVAKATDFTNLASSMQQQLVSRQLSADQEVAVQVDTANALLDKIAQLNTQIIRNEVGGQVSGAANDLRDQRDLAVMELAAIIPVQKVATKNGGLMLQTPGGDLLVQDGLVRQLKTGPIPGSSFNEVQFADTGLPATGIESGGKIGGLVTIRDTQISNYIDALDGIARNIIFSVNQLHASGTGTTAVTSYTSGLATSNSAGAVNAAPEVPFAANIVDGSFTIHVLDGNPPTNPGGTAINITAGTTSLNQIAADISAVAGVTASVNAAGALVIDGGANRIVFSNDSSNFLAAYEINTFFQGGGAADITVDAAILRDPGRIATATADPATSAVAITDNSAAMGMLALRDQALNVDGDTPLSLTQRAGNLAGQFGLDIATATQDSVFREAQATSLSAQREAVSGVNLDEEMINMMIFQRSYEASAKVIQTANQMLTTLMGILR